MSLSLVYLLQNETVTLGAGANLVFGSKSDNITINGGGNIVTLGQNTALTINDNRTVGDGYSGTINFGDAVLAAKGDVITLNYSLTLGASDNVSVNFSPLVTLANNNTVNTNFSVIAGKSDSINFSGSGASVLLTLASGDTVSTSGVNNYITIAGSATTKGSVTIGATAQGTTIDGGLGTDTFTGGAGYDGGNHYAGSYHGYQDGFNAIGTCVNYANMACRVTVNLTTNVGQAFDANGNALSPDTYTNIQQIKAGQLDGNDLTGSNSYYTEIKGGIGSVTYHGGAAGDRIIWSSAGTTGQLDGQGTDVAYGGSGGDEFYWRNSPGGKGVSNFGETIYGFNVNQADDLNLSEFASTGFAGVSTAFTFANLSSWVNVALNGNDTLVQFDRTGSGNFNTVAATLKNDNLFADFGVTDQSSAGAQQVVLNMYNSGHLVLTQPH